MGRLLDPEESLDIRNLRSPGPPREVVTEKLNFHLLYFQDEIGGNRMAEFCIACWVVIMIRY